jgi:hypothetical protein
MVHKVFAVFAVQIAIRPALSPQTAATLLEFLRPYRFEKIHLSLR